GSTFDQTYGIAREGGKLKYAAEHLADQITDVLMSILDVVGGNLAGAVGLRIDVRQGEWIKIMVDGVAQYFTDATEAVRFAINEILRGSHITGIDEAIREMLANADFTSFDELERGLQLVTTLVDGYAMSVEGLSSLEVEMNKFPSTIQ